MKSNSQGGIRVGVSPQVTASKEPNRQTQKFSHLCSKKKRLILFFLLLKNKSEWSDGRHLHICLLPSLNMGAQVGYSIRNLTEAVASLVLSSLCL